MHERRVAVLLNVSCVSRKQGGGLKLEGHGRVLFFLSPRSPIPWLIPKPERHVISANNRCHHEMVQRVWFSGQRSNGGQIRVQDTRQQHMFLSRFVSFPVITQTKERYGYKYAGILFPHTVPLIHTKRYQDNIQLSAAFPQLTTAGVRDTESQTHTHNTHTYPSLHSRQ